jgi:hypothetical protein
VAAAAPVPSWSVQVCGVEVAHQSSEDFAGGGLGDRVDELDLDLADAVVVRDLVATNATAAATSISVVAGTRNAFRTSPASSSGMPSTAQSSTSG